MQTKTRVTHLIALALAAVLMFLPFGIIDRRVERSSGGAAHEVLNTVSYVDAALYQNGNWAPMIALVLVGVLLVLVWISFSVKQNTVLYIAMAVCSLAALVLTLLPIITLGLSYFPPTSMAIAYLLACSLLFSVQHWTGHYFDDRTAQEE